MKKTLKVEIDCANCAAKLEEALKKIDGVKEASVSFMSQKVRLDVEDEKLDSILKEAQEVAKKVDSDCILYVD